MIMKRVFCIVSAFILIIGGIIGYYSPALGANQEYASLSVAPNVPINNMTSLQNRISLDLRDIEVKDALKFLAEKANMNIVPTNEVSGRVTLMIREASVSEIFEIVIRSNNLAYEKIGDIYNVMTEKEYKERYGKKFDDVRKVKVFHLKYVAPEQASKVIDSMKSSIGKVLVDSDAGTLMVLDTPEKIDEITTTLEKLERKSTVRIFTLRYARAKDVTKQLRSQLDLKKVGTIRADNRTNQVIVQTLPERMENIEKIIARLDQKTKQVLIDARIIQVKLNDNLSAGVEWEGLFELSKKHGTTYLGSYPLSSVSSTNSAWRSRQEVLDDTGYVGSYPFSGTTSDIEGGIKRVGTETMHIGVVGKNDFDVMIDYLKTLGDVKILSNPKLSVTNNQEARIHVGERQAYITTTTTAGQTTTTVSEQVTFMDVGLQLFITPTINDKGYVTLSIKPDISSVVGTVVTAQNNQIPIIDTSTAETTVMIKDGSTVAIGGLRREENTMDSKGVPILGSIPFLGSLFKSQNNRMVRNELLIMVTAHIIEGDELVTGEEIESQEYQHYQPMTTESDLTAYGEKQEEKSYQEYPALKAEEIYHPQIKSFRDE